MSTETQRPLSPIERWYWILDQVSPLNAIARVHIDGALDEASVSDAADALQARHPFLRVAVVADADGTDPRFVPSSGRLEVRTITGDAQAWEREVDTVELADGLDTVTGPLGRILHVDNGNGSHDLVLIASHIVADGATMLTLLRDLVVYAEATQRGEPPVIESLRSLEAPETGLPKAFRGMLGAVRSMKVALAEEVAIARARPKRLTAERDVEPTARRTRLIRRELDGAELAQLTAACKKAGVSVHGALSAALALAVGDELTPGQSGKVMIGSPVDFRDDLQPPVGRHEAGAYVCAVPSVLKYGPAEDLWAIAASTNAELRKRVEKDHHFALVSMLRLLTPKSLARSARTLRMVDQRGPGNICLSNLGRYEFPESLGEWTMSGTQLVAGISVSGFFVGVVNSSHGRLFWNFTYIEDIVSAERANRIVDATLHHVRSTLVGA